MTNLLLEQLFVSTVRDYGRRKLIYSYFIGWIIIGNDDMSDVSVYNLNDEFLNTCSSYNKKPYITSFGKIKFVNENIIGRIKLFTINSVDFLVKLILALIILFLTTDLINFTYEYICKLNFNPELLKQLFYTILLTVCSLGMILFSGASILMIFMPSYIILNYLKIK